MDHVYIARWTDGLPGVPPSKKERTERHLPEGCEPCGRLAELIACIQEERLAEPVVPEHLVRAAIAVFRPPGSAGNHRKED